MLSSRGGRLAILVLALGVRSARGGETGPALSTSDTCNGEAKTVPFLLYPSS